MVLEIEVAMDYGRLALNCIMENCRILQISENEIRIKSIDFYWIAITLADLSLLTLIILPFLPYHVFLHVVKHWFVFDIWILSLIYYLYIDDIIINMNKTIRKDNQYIYVNNKKYKRDDIDGIYITFGPGPGLGTYFSKRVTIIYYKKYFKHRKHLVAIRSEKAVNIAAKIIADFLETPLKNNAENS